MQTIIPILHELILHMILLAEVWRRGWGKAIERERESRSCPGPGLGGSETDYATHFIQCLLFASNYALQPAVIMYSTTVS